MKKIAIRVTSTKEFDALLAHMRGRGWKPMYSDWSQAKTVNETPEIVLFSNNWYYANLAECTIIDFSTFATIAGIDIPPTQIIVEIGLTGKITVTKDGANFNGVCGVNSRGIEEIYTAYKSLL